MLKHINLNYSKDSFFNKATQVDDTKQILIKLDIMFS